MSRTRLAQLVETGLLAKSLQARGLGEKAAAAKAELFAQAARTLVQAGVQADREVGAFFVPGRIEVLGKHTDYAGGRSIVTAVEQGFCTVAAPRADAGIALHAAALNESATWVMDPELVARHGHWSNYPMTVARRLARNFSQARRGADIAFVSDLPPASGMSSSSAMIVSTYLVLAAANGLEALPAHRRNLPDPLSLAAYLGTVENGQTFGELDGDRGVGTFGGSEDHTAMLCSQAGQLGQFAYCPARFERYIAMPPGYLFAVGFSGVVAEKTGAAQELYNRASQRVSAVVQAWRQATGRSEVYLADVLASGPAAAARLRQILETVRQESFSRAELIQRVEHFTAENEEIVAPAGDALAAGDLALFGRLVDRSQELTESLLENQVPQTAALAHLAREQGAAAASAFGAGFGGSVWAMVPSAQAGDFLRQWSARYAAIFAAEAQRARFFLTQAGPAACELRGE
jgi:galactokinase